MISAKPCSSNTVNDSSKLIKQFFFTSENFLGKPPVFHSKGLFCSTWVYHSRTVAVSCVCVCVIDVLRSNEVLIH